MRTVTVVPRAEGRAGRAARALPVFLAALLLGLSAPAAAAIPGISGMETAGVRTFHLSAKDGYISVPDGSFVYMWGYADEHHAGVMQYPGPTLIVNQGDTVVVQLTNELAEPVSIVFPGQTDVTASGDMSPGLLTAEAAPGATVSYTFVASRPGTYQYHSGSRPHIQIEMGLVGALIVRPGSTTQAYDEPGTEYDREYLMLLTEIDPQIHDLAEYGYVDMVDTTEYFPVMWFINGRAAPDTMLGHGVPWLPTQPYGALVQMHPGETLLVRLIGAGRDLHPFHMHANNFWVIARDGRLLQSAPGAGPDRAESDFTQTVVPGETLDALFTWTGEKLGWDMYGHAPGDPLEEGEYAPDHGKPFPVQLPGQQELTFGGMWSGSPFLGGSGGLPPSHVGGNEGGAYFFMWHSHTEKEMTSFDVFPGGMMTMLMIVHPDMHIHEMGMGMGGM